MSVVLDIYEKSRPLYLPVLDTTEDGVKLTKAEEFIGRGHDHLFSRELDWWFSAISMAVGTDLEPAPELPEKKELREFNALGYGSNRIRLDDWQITCLIALHLMLEDSNIGMAEDAPEKVSLSGAAVVDTANRYALAGHQPLLELMQDARRTELPIAIAAAHALGTHQKEAVDAFNEEVRPLTGRFAI